MWKQYIENYTKKFKKSEEDCKGSKFGTIQSSIFYYIPPFLLFVVGSVITLVIFSFDTLYRYFEASVPLNSLIIIILLFSVSRSFYNNYLLWSAGSFMNELDKSSLLDDIDDKEILRLQALLHTRGHLMDTKQMAEIIDKASQYNRIQFTDTEARIVKSKIGYRARINMSNVGFLAGILVMLGLLGTFLGLLGTIDAVGGAMAKMGSMGGEGSDMEKEMADFITGLSAPLQGMGVAFSSSLFGLSGSLLIGFVNHLCGGAQNNFIEDVSRWIDEHIPLPSSKMKKLAKDKRVPQGDDLKAWLASFVFMSNKMNKRLGQLFIALSKSEETSSQSVKYAELICAHQSHIKDGVGKMGGVLSSVLDELQGNSYVTKELSSNVDISLNSINNSLLQMNSNISIIKNSSEVLENSVSPISTILNEAVKLDREIVEEMRAQRNNIDGALESLNGNLVNMNESSISFTNVTSSLENTINTMNETTRNGFQALSDGNASVANILNHQGTNADAASEKLVEMTGLLNEFVNSQNNFVNEMAEIKNYLKHDQNNAKISNLVFEMNTLLEEVNQKNSDNFFGLFPENKDKGV